MAKTYTPAQQQYIRDNIKTQTIHQLATAIKTSKINLCIEIKALGLEHIITARKLASRIQKGNVPPNKGKKMQDYLSPEKIAILKKTMFKPGNMPHNTLPEGTETIRRDKCGRSYWYIKPPNSKRLVMKHRYLWEQYHQKKIPPRHKITFVDGDTNNFAIDNLKCISYQDQMLQNSIQNYPEDLKDLIRTKGQITRQINKHNSNGTNNQTKVR